MNKRLERDSENKVLGGVCGGLAKYFGFDAFLFRALFLLLIFVGGGGVAIYVVLWVILPETKRIYSANSSQNYTTFEKAEMPNKEKETNEGPDAGNISMGLLLLSAGILLLVNNLVPGFNFRKLWPLILIIVGGGLLISHKVSGNESSKNNTSNHEES